MREVKFVVTPFPFIDILDFTIQREVNQHFVAHITGHIGQTDDDEIVQRCAKEEAICIKGIDENGEAQTFFKGIVRDISCQNIGGLRKLTIEAVSRSWLLDTEEHTRTFQYEEQTYKEVADFIKEKNQAAFVYTRGIDEKTGEIIVQYEETDWNFLKRIASQINTVIVADIENDNIALCFGIPKKTVSYQAASPTYDCKKNLLHYTDMIKNHVEKYTEQDATSHFFEEREYWELCAPVSFLGQSLYVYKVISTYDGKELVHTYELRTQNGFKTKRQNNHKLPGCSLKGKVIDVTNNFVKVHCAVDAAQAVPMAKWFEYSTVYSHPNGTGWYCMPEIGDAVRISFPNEWERTGYAISAVHLSQTNQRRIDPNIKTLCTIHDKEIEFTPKTIRLTNNRGLTVLLDDELGISLFSSKDIQMHSMKDIRITGMKTVEIHGMEGVEIKQRRNRISIAGDIREWSEGIYHK